MSGDAAGRAAGTATTSGTAAAVTAPSMCTPAAVLPNEAPSSDGVMSLEGAMDVSGLGTDDTAAARTNTGTSSSLSSTTYPGKAKKRLREETGSPQTMENAPPVATTTESCTPAHGPTATGLWQSGLKKCREAKAYLREARKTSSTLSPDDITHLGRAFAEAEDLYVRAQQMGATSAEKEHQKSGKRAKTSRRVLAQCLREAKLDDLLPKDAVASASHLSIGQPSSEELSPFERPGDAVSVSTPVMNFMRTYGLSQYASIGEGGCGWISAGITLNWLPKQVLEAVCHQFETKAENFADWIYGGRTDLNKEERLAYKRQLRARRTALKAASAPTMEKPDLGMKRGKEPNRSEYMNTGEDLKAMASYSGRHVLLILGDCMTDQSGQQSVQLISPYFSSSALQFTSIFADGRLGRWEDGPDKDKFRADDLVLILDNEHFNAIARPRGSVVTAPHAPV